MQGKSNVDISKLEHARKKFCWPSLLLKCIVVSKRHRLTACLRSQLCRGRGWEWRMNTNDKSWWSWYVMDPTSSRQQPFVSEHMSDISSSSCCLSACVQRPAANRGFPREAEGRRDERRKGGRRSQNLRIFWKIHSSSLSRQSHAARLPAGDIPEVEQWRRQSLGLAMRGTSSHATVFSPEVSDRANHRTTPAPDCTTRPMAGISLDQSKCLLWRAASSSVFVNRVFGWLFACCPLCWFMASTTHEGPLEQ